MLKRLAAGETCFDVMPPFKLVAFVCFPAKQDHAALAHRRKIYQTVGVIFQLHAKTFQLAGRLASIPTALSGLPAAVTSLNYLKQIVVTKGISMRFTKLLAEIRPGLRGDNR